MANSRVTMSKAETPETSTDSSDNDTGSDGSKECFIVTIGSLPRYLHREISLLDSESLKDVLNSTATENFVQDEDRHEEEQNQVVEKTSSTPQEVGKNDGNETNAQCVGILSVHSIAKLKTRAAQFIHLLLRRHFLTDKISEVNGLVIELIYERARAYEAFGFPELAVGDGIAVLEGVEIVIGGEESDLIPLRKDGSRWMALEEEECGDGEEEDNEEDQATKQRHQGTRDNDNNADRTKEIRDAIELKYQCLIMLYRAATILGCFSQADLWWEMAVETCKIVVWHALNESGVREKVKQDVNDVWLLYPHQNSKWLGRKSEVNAQGFFGSSQRLIYPWNDHEPNRLSDSCIAEINHKLQQAAPLLEVRKSSLPALTAENNSNKDRDNETSTTNGDGFLNAIGIGDESTQLGLYATADLKPGLITLTERSALTGIRPHGEALCDACAADMEEVPQSERLSCPGCDIPFCSIACFEAAKQKYHQPNEDDAETEDGYPPPETPFCPGSMGNTDIQTLGRAESSTTEEWDLYFLLLSRTLQIAETQNIHPLDLFEIKYLWGDFSTTTPAPTSSTPTSCLTYQPSRSKTLPYSLRHHVELPLQWFEILMLSRPECAPYSAKWLARYDWWVIQTLYAKFRGVADAKQSSWTGKPEIAAVHPLWCLANHSCAPNVTWKPGGLRNLTVVEERIWEHPDPQEQRGAGVEEAEGGKEKEEKEKDDRWLGIRKDEQIWNHYTDVRADYKERRERLMGVLGGECMCERCIYEASKA